MKTTTLIIALFFPISVMVACGGDDEATTTTAATSTTGGTAGGGAVGGDGGSGEGGGGTGGMATGGSATGGSGGAPDCRALGQDVRAKLIAAQQCDPLAPQTECTKVVDGICCPEIVNAGKMAETLTYEMALDTFQAACTIDCPPDPPCNMTPTGACMPAAVGGQCAIVP